MLNDVIHLAVPKIILTFASVNKIKENWVMKESNVRISIDDAIEMYHSGNEKFKKIALDAFGELSWIIISD